MSNYKTLAELTQDVIKSLSMYAGTATQVYAEDRIAAMIVRIFNRLFEDRFWDEHTFWYKYTLTGEKRRDYQKRNNNKAVKKTLSIPEWLNEIATAKDISFGTSWNTSFVHKYLNIV